MGKLMKESYYSKIMEKKQDFIDNDGKLIDFFKEIQELLFVNDSKEN